MHTHTSQLLSLPPHSFLKLPAYPAQGLIQPWQSQIVGRPQLFSKHTRHNSFPFRPTVSLSFIPIQWSTLLTAEGLSSVPHSFVSPFQIPSLFFWAFLSAASSLAARLCIVLSALAWNVPSPWWVGANPWRTKASLMFILKRKFWNGYMDPTKWV